MDAKDKKLEHKAVKVVKKIASDIAIQKEKAQVKKLETKIIKQDHKAVDKSDTAEVKTAAKAKATV